MHRIRFVLAAAVIVFASPGILAERAAAQEPTTLRVALIPGDLSQCWYAQDKGFFEQAGLKVEITPVSNGAAIIASVASGAIDIGYSNPLSIAVAYQRGIPLQIIAPAGLYLASSPTNARLSVRADSPIHSAKDLEGKTVAVNGLDNNVYYAIRAWIDANGGDSSKVRFVEFPLTELPSVVRSGQVDAGGLDALGDPNLGKPGDSLRLLANAFDAVSPDFMTGAWFTTRQWVEAHPEAAKKFKAVMLRAAVWANGHHLESAEILAKHSKLTVAQLGKIVRMTYGTVLNAQLVQPNIDVAAKYGALRHFSAEDLISKVVAGGSGTPR
jgi:NitT/TauT family transport system substrate-binding protein